MLRPTHNELSGKIRQAKTAVARNRMRILTPDVLIADALHLGYLIEELPDILGAILEECRPDHYSGGRPPQRSYRDDIKSLELYAFAWVSGCLGHSVYFKFATRGGVIWVVSLHRSRVQEEQGRL